MIFRKQTTDSQIVDELIESTKPPVPRQYGLRLFNIVYCIFWACIVWSGIIGFAIWLTQGFKG